MAVWTVDTWKIKAGKEPHFLQCCAPLSPVGLVLFQDLLEPSLFWSPEKWESEEALQTWREGDTYLSAFQAIKDDVMEHSTHRMKDVAGFPPRR